MKKMILGILVLMSLWGCEQGYDPLVGRWSYNTPLGTVTYSFNADKSCSVTVLDSTTEETETRRGTYTILQPSRESPKQLSIAWEAAETTSVLPAAIMTALTWNETTGGLSLNLSKQ